MRWKWPALATVLAVVIAACAGDEPAIEPTTTTSSIAPAAATSTTGAETPSGILSRSFQEWEQMGISDYDLEYVITREDGSDSGRYRAIVREGEPLSCFRDEVHSRRLPCDASYYTIEGIFGRIVAGDARLAEIEYDPTYHFPTTVDHALDSLVGSPYSLEVLSFAVAQAIDWLAYMDEVVSFWEAGYMGTASVDWDEVRTEARRRVEAVPRQTNAHVALSQATRFIPGAGFASAVEAERAFDDAMATVRRLTAGAHPRGERLPGDVGYVEVAGVDPDRWESFAAELNGVLADLEAGPVCGWIIDLRAYRFADPVREIVGLGPLLGEGPIETIVTASGDLVWEYRAGQVFVGGDPAEVVYAAEGIETAGLSLEDPYIPANRDAPVAVLFGVETAHSLLVVALDAREGVRTFGHIPSVGPSTVNLIGSQTTLRMPDGAVASISSIGRAIGGLRPDQVVLAVPDSGSDEVLDAAISWLSADFGCSG